VRKAAMRLVMGVFLLTVQWLAMTKDASAEVTSQIDLR
jgi:hypothetical protein